MYQANLMQKNRSGFNLLFLPFIFFLNFSIKAQQKIIKRETILSDYVFKGNHIRVDFAMLSFFKSNLIRESGDYPANTTLTSGPLVSFKYQVNFNNCNSLIFGPQAIIAGRNFNVSFNKNDFSPPLKKDYAFHGSATYVTSLVLSFPVLLEKRYLYKKTKLFFINGGLQFNASTGADFDIFNYTVENVNNVFFDVAEVNVYANNDAKPWISFPLNAGYGWLLKNNNILQLAITSGISFTKFVKGTYQITIPNKPVTKGRYNSTGSFIGLAINYLFTNANFRVRKSYEKNAKM